MNVTQDKYSNINENIKLKDKIFSNKNMFIIFLMNYIIFLSSFCVINYSGYSFFEIISKVFFLSIIYGNILAIPLHIPSLIMLFYNLKNNSTAIVVLGLIFSIIMPLYTSFWHFFLAMGYSGLFTSKIMTLIFIIDSGLLFWFCLFKLILRVK